MAKKAKKVKEAVEEKNDTGVYLIICDEGTDFDVVVYYVAYLSKVNKAHISILHTTDFDDFVHWGDVEERMRKDMREKAEKTVWSVANRIYELNGQVCGVYLEEGESKESLIDIVEKEDKVRALVLGAKTSGSGPGPLVSYFTGKGVSKLKIPLIMVPEDIDTSRIEKLLK